MATEKRFRDYLYLLIIATQLVGMLVLDLVEFYPKSLYEAPEAPLHFLADLKVWYITFSGDPYFSEATHKPWYKLFLASEGLIQLPFAAYLVYQLSSTRPSTGRTELAAVVLGTIVGLTAGACCFDVWNMGPEAVAEDKKDQVLYGTYLPFCVIPTIMAVDMYRRLLARLES